MTKTKAWITALRLRTLPLSVSGVITGSLIALSKSIFDWKVFFLALTTTLFLQILSNLANDYGDNQNGADNLDRIGPERMVQSGVISAKEMKRMIVLFTTMASISGVSLLLVSHLTLFSDSFFVLLILGIFAIWAALTYTIGNNPYGYSGWGDLSVFLFFGLLSVIGTYYLYAGKITPDVFLPAVSIGALSVGVLNINNMRDHDNDKAAGKNTVVVKIGVSKAKYYHMALLVIALMTSLLYMFVNHIYYLGYLFVFILVPLTKHLLHVFHFQNPSSFDKELKKLALITILFSLAFGTVINI
jgi:1,4-dihydroxy-2-naphthoate octaprenyltransferase